MSLQQHREERRARLLNEQGAQQRSPLSTQQFLPGTEHMREAKPHEQTESQFHSRPDVYVHGRNVKHGMMEPMAGRLVFDGDRGHGFHAGTEKSAHERLQALGTPHYGTEPRFFHGRVDPMKMQNSPTEGLWEKIHSAGPSGTADRGRRPDEGDDWERDHFDSYYRNDYEDKGSTSVILGTENVKYQVKDPVYGGIHHRQDFKPKNFQTWRGSVTDALAGGERVPDHVQHQYYATGGADGPEGVVHTHFDGPKRGPLVPYHNRDAAIPGLEVAKVATLGKQWN